MRPRGSWIHEFESSASLSACHRLSELCCTPTRQQLRRRRRVIRSRCRTRKHNVRLKHKVCSLESISFIWVLFNKLLLTCLWKRPAALKATYSLFTSIWTLWPNHLLVPALPHSQDLTVGSWTELRWQTEWNILNYTRTPVTVLQLE